MSQCEEWPGPFFASGYGRIRVANKDKRVHRVIWERAHGSLKPHEHVLHACDAGGGSGLVTANSCDANSTAAVATSTTGGTWTTEKNLGADI